MVIEVYQVLRRFSQLQQETLNSLLLN